jgi:hypothetical protein
LNEFDPEEEDSKMNNRRTRIVLIFLACAGLAQLLLLAILDMVNQEGLDFRGAAK